MLRPMKSLPFKPAMAAWASFKFGISTKPKPRLCPVNLSLIRDTEFDLPVGSKQFPKLVFSRIEGKIANINIHLCPFFPAFAAGCPVNDDERLPRC